MNPAWLLFPLTLVPLREAAHVRLRRHTLVFPGLPGAWDGLTLLFLSDTHIRRLGRRERHLGRLIDGIEVDLLLIGGDVAAASRSYDVALDLMSRVKARLGRYAVRGNSEQFLPPKLERIRQKLAGAGIRLLDNRHETLYRNNEPLTVGGVNCSYSGKSDFVAAFDGAPENGFRILLMHAPEGLLQIGTRRADLILSGHTHGGQIRLPGMKALYLHTRTDVDLDAGVFDADRLRLFWPDASPTSRMLLSAGVGTSTFPVRLFCPPEIHLVTLTAEDSTPAP